MLFDETLSKLRGTAQIGPDGRRLSYLDTGARASGSLAAPLRTLVLLHAFPLNASMWEPQFTAVPDGWRFVAPDFRGFGSSEDDSGEVAGEPAMGGIGALVDPSLDDYARDVVALLDKIDVRRAVVCGLSMGGYVAFALWRRAPERVEGLLLADTKAEADSEDARRGRVEMIGLLNQHGVPAVIDRMVPRLLGDHTRRQRPEIEPRIRSLAAHSTAIGVSMALMRMMGRPDSTPLLPRIDRPVLVLAGAEDSVTPPDIARQMQQQIPGARLVVVPEAGHLSNLEQPAAFGDALSAFLAGLNPRSGERLP